MEAQRAMMSGQEMRGALLNNLSKVEDELRQIFMSRWELWKGTPWEDSKQNGRMLVKFVESEIEKGGANPVHLNSDVNDLLRNGRVSQWDIQGLTLVLRYLHDERDTEDEKGRKLEALEQITFQHILINDSETTHKKYLTCCNFYFLKSMKESLTTLGVHEDKVEEILKSGFAFVPEMNADMDKVKEIQAGRHHLMSAMMQMAYCNYSKAIELCSKIIEIPSALGSEFILEARRIRFDALQKLHLRQGSCGSGMVVLNVKTRRVLINDALKIAEMDETDEESNMILYWHFASSKDEPYQALYHFNQWSTSRLDHAFPGVKRAILNAAQTYHDPQVLLIEEGFKYWNIVFTTLKLKQTQETVEKLRKVLVLFKEGARTNVPIADFAYSACLLMFSDFIENDESIRNNSFREFDITAAIQMLKDIAGQSGTPHLPRDPNTKADNDRIGSAQFLMGLLYEHGQHVTRNYIEAKKWFKKAAIRHNIGHAAFHLGKMYFYGVDGIPKNIELAKLYLEQAVASGTQLAFTTLAVLYLNQFEFEKGLSLLRKLSDVQKSIPDLLPGFAFYAPQYKKWFEGRIENEFRLKWNYKVKLLNDIIEKEFELPYNLTSKGLTLLDRVKRAELLGFSDNVKNIMDGAEFSLQLAPCANCIIKHELNGTLDSFVENITRPKEKGKNEVTTTTAKLENRDSVDTAEEESKLLVEVPTNPIYKEDDERSSFLSNIDQVGNDFKNVYEMLTSMIGEKKLGAAEFMIILKTLYDCFKYSPSLKLGLYLCRYYDTTTRAKVRLIMRYLMAKCPIVDYQLKARLLYVMFNYFELSEYSPYSSIEDSVTIKCDDLNARRFVDEPLYFQWVAEMGLAFDVQQPGIKIIDELENALEKYPNNLVLLYSLADSHFRLYSMRTEEVVEGGVGRHQFDWHAIVKVLARAVMAYREFLRRAPAEHPLYPVAAYSLSWTYTRLLSYSHSSTQGELLWLRTRLEDSDRKGVVEEFYEDIARAYTQGVISESKQLKFFPLAASCEHLKRRVELFMKMNSSHFPRRKFARLEDRKYVFSKTYLVHPLRIFSVIGLRFRLRGASQPSPRAGVAYKIQPLSSFIAVFLSTETEWNDGRLILPFLRAPDSQSYNSCVKLTVIDDVYFGSQHIHVLTEDASGNTIFVIFRRSSSISRVDNKLKLEFGTTLMIANIDYEVGGDEPACIRVGEAGCQSHVILTGKIINMCRFCGAPDSTKRCTKCKRTYCSSECQQKDFKLMKHKYVCN